MNKNKTDFQPGVAATAATLPLSSFFISLMPKTSVSLLSLSGAKRRRRQRGVVSSSLVVISLYHTVMLRRSALAWVQGVRQRSLNPDNMWRNRHAIGKRTGSIVNTFEFGSVQHQSHSLSLRRFASEADDRSGDNETEPQKKKGKKKYKVRDDIGQEQLDKLAEAFDELAKKEGFDSSLAYYADDETFEDEFIDEDYLDFDEEDDVKGGNEENREDDISLDSSQFGLEDFDDGTVERDEDGPLFTDDDHEDMDARIAAAKRDMDMGQVSVPVDLDDFASELSPADLRKLGFRQEVNPFGNDETPRKEQFKLITNSMICSACGADFQCHSDQKPGYLPPEKFDIQVKLNKIEEMQRLQEKAGSDEWSVEDEVEWLIQKGSKGDSAEPPVDDIAVDTITEQMGLDLVELSKKKIICKRCHGLQNFGKVDNALRPGWTKEPLLSQEKFRDLLRPIREKPAVIIALIDLFDFAGSVLPELDNIAGNNPVILAANKADLLPSKMGKQRAENWVRRELEYLGVRSLANVGGAVRLISCKTGVGVGAMLEKARALAEEIDCDIYVVGAANAGKSTLMNYVLDRSSRDRRGETIQKRRAGNANARKDALTTSPLPGTTLKFIKVELNGGRSLYDTPGLLVPGTITQILTSEELKIVVPKK